ncbi:MAG TPA: DUF4919 domain-containing protein [Pyrinomonadaceae bacterium]|nr:DUF4919 domain-containing protein [Pyrinomonadaceae bacterium]
MKNRLLVILFVSLCASAQAAAQTATTTPTPAQTPAAQASPTPAAKPQKPPSEKKKKYEALLEKAKKGEGEVDYGALRQAFFETEDYSPLSGMFAYRGLWGLVMQQNWPEAVRQAEAVLAQNYVDINAHMVAFIAHRQQGDTEKAKLHRQWADGLLASVKSGGDGRSPATAWHVISTSEEYAVFRSMSLRAVGQALIQNDGHSYDEMRVLDPQNNESKLYFNVDKPMSAYGRK